MGAKKKKVVRKGKKERKGHESSKKYAKYTVEGDSVKRAVYCPRCGPGVFMADHQNRHVCGKCGYVEIK
jgi:small subunit ribosomal protein S27Ae